MSTLNELQKHGDHDQSSHGAWGDDSEGEDSSEPKNYKPYRLGDSKDDSEGEYGDSESESPRWMDTMDYPRKKN